MRYHCTQIGHFAITRTRLWNNNKAQKLPFLKGGKQKLVAGIVRKQEMQLRSKQHHQSLVMLMNTLLLKIWASNGIHVSASGLPASLHPTLAEVPIFICQFVIYIISLTRFHPTQSIFTQNQIKMATCFLCFLGRYTTNITFPYFILWSPCIFIAVFGYKHGLALTLADL